MMMLVMAVIVVASVVFAVQGIQMHMQVNTVEAEFHANQLDYLGQNTKAQRDLAKAGSDLNLQQAEIANTPSELLRLKLVGVGKILTGIFLLLLGILMALIIMPVRLGMIIKKK